MKMIKIPKKSKGRSIKVENITSPVKKVMI